MADSTINFLTAQPFVKYVSCYSPINQIMSTAQIVCKSTNGSQTGRYLIGVGNLSIDIHLPISQYPIHKEVHQPLVRQATLAYGGAYNALIAASRIGLGSAPLGYIPNDDFLPLPKELHLQLLLRHPNAHTPTCAALVDPHAIHTFLASNEHPTSLSQIVVQQPLPKHVIQHVKNAAAILIDGYALHSDLQLVENVLEIVNEHNIPLWIDPQPAAEYLLQHPRKHPKESEALLRLLQSATGLSMNIAESSYLISKSGYSLSDTSNHISENSIHHLVNTFCPRLNLVLVKNGSNGCFYCQRDSNNNWRVMQLPSFSITEEKFRDTIGAGDAFVGAFLAARYKLDLSVHDSCIVANSMGAATCLNTCAGVNGIGKIYDCKRFLQDQFPHLANKLGEDSTISFDTQPFKVS